MNRMLIALAALATPVAVFTTVQSAEAQAQTCSAAGPPCIYSIKFICGDQPAIPSLKPPSEPPVKPGNYATAINIHNFHQIPVTIQKSAVIANPEEKDFGPISMTRVKRVGAGQAFEIDCQDILSLFQPQPTNSFIKGFVELRGSFPTLSVTAVYTAQATTAATAPSGPVSIEVVPVQPFTGP